MWDTQSEEIMARVRNFCYPLGLYDDYLSSQTLGGETEAALDKIQEGKPDWEIVSCCTIAVSIEKGRRYSYTLQVFYREPSSTS
jgi:hypothetical protein